MQDYNCLFKTLRPNALQNVENMFTKEVCTYYILYNTSKRVWSRIPKSNALCQSAIASLFPHSQNTPKLNGLQKQSCFSYLQVCGSAGMSALGCRSSGLTQDQLCLFQIALGGGCSAFLLTLLGSAISWGRLSHGKSQEGQRQTKLGSHKHT